MLKYYKQIGWASVIFGLATTLLAWPTFAYLEFAMITMIPGFLCSSLYVMYTLRHELPTPWINPGYLGLLLSSAPIIFFLIYILSS